MNAPVPPALQWHPLESLSPRFQANLAVLEHRDPALARRLRDLTISVPFFIAAAGDDVYLGRAGTAGVATIPDPVPPVAARALAARIFPAGVCNGPLLVSGLGYGWLWDRLAKLPAKVDAAPGHRPPAYFLAGDLEQLWAVLHVMDWRAMLAERRFLILAGTDAFEQLRQKLIADPTWPEPRGLVRIDASLPVQDLHGWVNPIRQARDERLGALCRALHEAYAPPRGSDWQAKFRSGRLRVLGITSLYTTFLQHSMRDWLAAFDRLGHETRLVIEQEHHLMTGACGYAQAIHEFDPDLIVIIDHYRAEIGELPKSIPCVMWVQDHLPNIYNAAAGAAQGPRDYTIGFGRLQLTQSLGYPAERFMSCPIGINEERFKPAVLSEQDRARYGCDVSYVSHASTPADVLLKAFLARNSDPNVAKLLWDYHDRLVGEFDRAGLAHSDWALEQILKQSIAQTGLVPSDKLMSDIQWLFKNQIYNALFRHRALEWVADLGFHLKLYGNNWDAHPTLGRFACGPADTARDVPKICAASKVNLQITPFGAVHQRLLEGLVAGGFYLIRWTPGDQLGAPYRFLRNWCVSQGISSESALRAAIDPAVRNGIAQCDELREDVSAARHPNLYERLMAGLEVDLTGRAGGAWPEEYAQVSFRNADELKLRLTRFLRDEPERRRISAKMRDAIMETYSYAGISQRLIQFIAADLAARDARMPAAA